MSPDDPHPYEPCPTCGRMLAPDNEYTDRGLTLPAYCCPDCNRRVFFYLGQPIEIPSYARLTPTREAYRPKPPTPPSEPKEKA